MMGLGMLMGGGQMRGSARDNAPQMTGQGPRGLGGMMGMKPPMRWPGQPGMQPQQPPMQNMPVPGQQLPPEMSIQGLGPMMNNPQFMQMLQQHMGQYGGRGGYLGAIR